jgi:hypothetical protein
LPGAFAGGRRFRDAGSRKESGSEQVDQIDGRCELLADESVAPLKHVFVRQIQTNLPAHRELAVQLLQTPVEVRELRGYVVFRMAS